MGQILGKITQRGGDRKSKSHDATLKLEDIGVDKHKSSRLQKIASLPDDAFESYVAERQSTKEAPNLLGAPRLACARENTSALQLGTDGS